MLTCPRLRRASSILLLATLAAGSVQAERVLYRYLDDKGQVVLNDNLPPSAASRGYEIIRPDGRLVKSVDPALPADEVEAERLRQEEEAAQQRWDESLLLRYSSVDDIEDAKKRALGDIQIRISILKGNLNYLKTQVEREEARAAEMERRNQDVSQTQKDTIATLKSQIADVEDLIAIREREKAQTSKRFDRDISRFTVLLESIGRRR
ncbi:hypothetical protein [Litorivivens sp.]|uniref:hypothetical protein n=1 Tax=Litorivivens sp. TaxID=2020868 RepID=UPI00356ADE40